MLLDAGDFAGDFVGGAGRGIGGVTDVLEAESDPTSSLGLLSGLQSGRHS